MTLAGDRSEGSDQQLRGNRVTELVDVEAMQEAMGDHA